MIKTLFFLWKYKILKNPKNLSYQTNKFFDLSKRVQEKILDKYFDKFYNEEHLEIYFDDRASHFYQDGIDISFFHCYYFDKKLLEYRLNCISYVDEFKIEAQEKEKLIQYVLRELQDGKKVITSKDLVHYPDDLPKSLSGHLEFMTYLVHQDVSNIKYITYREECVTRQRELIQKGIENAKKEEFSFKKFLKNNGELPKILQNNLDFIIYLIENDISYVDYLNEKLIESITISNQKRLVHTIIHSLQKKPNYLKLLEKNTVLSNILNVDMDFIYHVIDMDIDYIRYVDWHNLSDLKRKQVIIYTTKKAEEGGISIDIMKYHFHELFFQNSYFMKYLLYKDFRWIAVSKVESKEENDALIDLFFDRIKQKHYQFRLEDFMEDGVYINHRLVENEKMLHYFFENKVAVVQHIDFFHLNSSKKLVDDILKELEKNNYEFHNDDFLVDGKYPIPLSNHYRFMKYVIDKNFNHLAYINTAMIDARELKRIINYAFRMVYYIRGSRRDLSFDIDGYFKNSDIIHDEYFKECLESL